MCGIVGFTGRPSGSGTNVLGRALQCLKHRGPNQQGQFSDNEISLGAVRLRIQDLQGGDQPLASDDGNTVLVFNGEVFNYKELREELRNEGYQFNTQCDTEVVLKAFLAWGTGSFSKFRGM